MEQLSKQEFRALLEAAKAASKRDWLMILVGRNHGLRASELVGFTRDNIKDGFLVIQRCKGSKETVQPLISSDDPLFDERTALLDYISQMNSNQAVFKMSTRHCLRLIHRHAASAGLPQHKGKTKILKQTCGRQLLETKPINYVQTWLGHKSLSSTGAYTRVSDEEAGDACKGSFKD